MKKVICIIIVLLIATVGRAQEGCFPDTTKGHQIVIRGITCPSCMYDYEDSVSIYRNTFIWAGIHIWTDSVYFAEAIPFELWQSRRVLLLSNTLWGDTICSMIRSFSLLRKGIQRNHGLYVEWHTQLYIEVIATEEPALGEWVYSVTAIHVLEKFHGQPLGIER